MEINNLTTVDVTSELQDANLETKSVTEFFGNIICLETRSKLIAIFEILLDKRKEFCSQQEIATALEVSRKSINEFENGKFNFNLFDGYCGYLGYDLEINIYER